MSSASLHPAVVVTGASSGIGRELARLAAGDGSFMMLVGRSSEALDELVAEFSAHGVQSAALIIDLTDPQAGGRIEAALAQRLLYCDVLVNSAGFGLFGMASEIDRTEQLQLLDVNARALTELTLRFLPSMIERRRGGILNVGSVSGYTPGPYMAAYFASKAYVRSFSSALSAEMAGTGVTVTCLDPGVVRTAFFHRQSAGWTRLTRIAPRSNASDVAMVGWRTFKAGKRFVIPRWVDRMEAELRRRRIARLESITMTTNRAYGRRPFARGEIYKLLANPVYVGEIGHKGQHYQGQHPAIIDRDTWTTVRAQLATNTHARYVRLDAKDPSLLAGLLHDDQGNRLTPTHANKQGKRYRYYALQRTQEASRPRGRPKDTERRWRISAAEIERVVIERLGNVLLDRRWLLDRCVLSTSAIEQQNAIINNGQALAERLNAASAGELRELLLGLIGRVTLAETEVRLDISASGLRARLRPTGQSASQTDEPDDAKSISWVDDNATDRDRRAFDPVPEAFSITIPVALRRRGVETKLIIEPPDGGPRLDPDATLIKLVAQAHHWREDILAGRFPTMRSLAKAYDKDERHIARLIPLAFLAPTIVEAIIAGSQPADLVAQDLIMLRDIPAEWNAQRAMLGFVLPQPPR